MRVTKKLREWLISQEYISEAASDCVAKSAAGKALSDNTLTPAKLAELSADEDDEAGKPPVKAPTAADVFGGKSNPRVVPASEGFSTKQVEARHVKTGAPVRLPSGQPAMLPSELDAAKCGTWIKWVLQRGGANVELREVEKSLLHEMFERDKFVGSIGGEDVDNVPGSRVKALLDDAVGAGSGGLELNPAIFDQQLILFPLLHSELLPLIDLVDLPRGRRVEAASLGNPTITSGVAEGTAMTPFTTDNMIAALDATIFNATCAIEIGLDLLSDSPANLGQKLSEALGQASANWLDTQIANGDGTTEPQGIFVASGTTVVSAAGAGAWAIADCESLLFSVAKQYRNAAGRCCFVANDTTYQRLRAIPVGAGDARRLFGMDHESYTLLGRPFKIQNNITNAKAAFVAMGRYRLWRRLGATLKFTSEGRTLSLANLGLLTLRQRYGGRLIDAAACAKCVDGQA